jgi:signal transduction histidine kinase
MISTSFLTVLPVAAGAFLLGTVTLISNSRQFTNRIFAALSITSAAYVVVNYLADYDQARALFWVRGTFSLSALMLLGLVLFLNSFPKRVLSKPWDYFLALIASAVAIAAYLPAFVPSVVLMHDKTNVRHGSLYPVFLVYLVALLTLIIVVTLKSFRISRGLEKERLKYVMYGSFITVALLVLTNVVLPLIQGHDSFASLGSYFILIFIGFSSYAVVKHRLFNVRMLVTRALAYLLLLVALGVIYAAAFFAMSLLLFPGEQAAFSRGIGSTILALVLAFTFQPLRRLFQIGTDRIFYRDHYDSQAVLNRFTGILVSELHLDAILKRAVAELCNSLHIQFGQIVIFNAERVYKIEHFGPLPKRLMVAPELKRLNKHMLIADELEGGERKRILDDHGVRVSLMLSTKEDFVGYLLLGDKLSGDIYSTQDVELLEIIRGELAVAIQNAKSYAEVQAFNLTLQARVDHATNRLRVANRHLQELDKAKDEFISMASHQLRTPLTTIKGYLSMMLEGDVGQVPEGQQQFIRYAFDASERMVNLISDLLNVSRMSAGRFLIQTKPTDMVQMIDDEVRQLTPHAKAKNIGLVFERPPAPLPLVEIDDNKTRQVIMNFIDNAIYYTSKGGVHVHLEQTGNHVRLRVKDTGIGVPEEAKRKLFTKFYRAGNAQSLRPDGTGLGLYLAKRVIEDQGGTIIFESAEGKGSTFGFELPLKAQAVHKNKEKIHAGK